MVRVKNKGITLVETLLAAALVVFIFAALVVLFQQISRSIVRAKEEIAGDRMNQYILSRLKNIPFWQLLPRIETSPWGVFPIDSDRSDFGLAGSFDMPPGVNQPPSPYPSLAVLEDIRDKIQEAGFDRFTVEVVFWRRKRAGESGNVSDLVQFQPDGGTPPRDVYDPQVRFFDQNHDGDFNDVYISTRSFPYNDEWMSEVPSTNLREIRIKIYKNGGLIAKNNSMINLGQFTGETNVSAEARLRLSINKPVQNGVLHMENAGSVQKAEFELNISSPYPSWVQSNRFDDGGLLSIEGNTEPNAQIHFTRISDAESKGYLNSGGGGSFSGTLPSEITSEFAEGENFFVAFTSKSVLRSPYAIQRAVWDKTPPAIADSTPTPASLVRTLSPYVGARIFDVESATDIVSGLCPYVTRLEVDGANVPFKYDSKTGWVYWIDEGTGLPPVLSSHTAGVSPRTYNVWLGGGDYAMYKTSASWSFDVGLVEPDSTPPEIGACTFTDNFTIHIPIRDDESGINPDSIRIAVDGIDVVDAANVKHFWDARRNEVVYIAETTYGGGGSHTVETQAENWLAQQASTFAADGGVPCTSHP